jgi:hypothetical protein
MNKLQLIASAISGYEPYKSFTSAKDDYYYNECNTESEKLEQILNYAANVYEIELTQEECQEVYNFLEKEKALDQSGRQNLFDNLGDDEKQLITFRVDQGLYYEFKSLCNKEGWSMSKLFINLMKDLVNDKN